MSNTPHPPASEVSFVSLLTLLFITLKLTHVIDWSWVRVLSPMWVSFGLLVVLVTLPAAIVYTSKAVSWIIHKVTGK